MRVGHSLFRDDILVLSDLHVMGEYKHGVVVNANPLNDKVEGFDGDNEPFP